MSGQVGMGLGRVMLSLGLAATLAACGVSAPSATTQVGVPPSSPADTTGPPDAPAPSTTTPGEGSGPGQPEPLAAFQMMEVRDPMVDNFRAVGFLAPTGWVAQGGIHWEHSLRPLAALTLTVTDPSGAYGIQTYFPPQLSWISEPSLQNPGANWMGAIMAAPRSAGDAVLDLVLPHYRPGARVVGVIPVQPPLPSAGPGHHYEAVRVRVVYDTSGGPMEEDFHAIVSYLRADSGLGAVFDSWGFEMLYSLRAPAGQLDAMLPTLELIMASMEIDLRWMVNYLAVYELFTARNYAAIDAAAELSNLITRTYEEIGQIHRQTWENQMQTQDRIHQNFTDYIRDTQRVRSESGGISRVPRGVACQNTATGVLFVLPDGSSCPTGTVRLQQVP